MSADGIPFHRSAPASELIGKPPSGAVDANSSCIPGAADHLRDLAGVEPLPGDQREKLSLFGSEPRKRSCGRVELTADAVRVERSANIRPHSLGDSLAPTFAPLIVGQHAPRRAVEPEPRRIARRNLVEPAPSDQERLGNNVGGVFATHPTPRIPEHAMVVRLVHRLEAIAPVPHSLLRQRR